MSEKFYPIEAVRAVPSSILSSTEKLSLILLLDYLNCKEVYVSAGRIAEEASLSVPTVERAFKKFKRLKIMRTRKVRRGQSYLHLKTFDLGLLRTLAMSSKDGSASNELSSNLDFEIDLSDL